MGEQALPIDLKPGSYIVAVSGGVDSVVLLHALSSISDITIRVAHFDHGIRSDSAADARFVEALAAQYGYECDIQREELGAGASEALARTRRYRFLRELAKQYNSKLITAHHADDIVESVAINSIRGTGWRGLAVLAAEDVERPLGNYTKSHLLEYACNHRLEWCEDSTNMSNVYLRNRVRHAMHHITPSDRQKIVQLRRKQLALAQTIDREIARFDEVAGQRYFITMIDESIAFELLRRQTGGYLTRPQLARMLMAIKTGVPGSTHTIGSGITLELARSTYTVETPYKLL